MAVNRPTFLVGEGNPNWKEYVVPTDPAHRRRAMALTGALMGDLGAHLSIPRLATGGTIPIPTRQLEGLINLHAPAAAASISSTAGGFGGGAIW